MLTTRRPRPTQSAAEGAAEVSTSFKVFNAELRSVGCGAGPADVRLMCVLNFVLMNFLYSRLNELMTANVSLPSLLAVAQ